MSWNTSNTKTGQIQHIRREGGQAGDRQVRPEANASGSVLSDLRVMQKVASIVCTWLFLLKVDCTHFTHRAWDKGPPCVLTDTCTRVLRKRDWIEMYSASSLTT